MKDYQSCSTFQREAESNLYKRFDNIIADEFSQLFLMSAKKLLAPALGRWKQHNTSKTFLEVDINLTPDEQQFKDCDMRGSPPSRSIFATEQIIWTP